MFPVKLVQILNKGLNALVNRCFEQMPVEALGLVPFAPLAKLAAHEQQFFSGMRPHISVQRAQVRELLPFVARHLVQQRALHVHDFIMREGENEVLSPRIEQTKSQRGMIARAKERIGLKILERVVHPAHVPLEIKTQPAGINRMTDRRPGG